MERELINGIPEENVVKESDVLPKTNIISVQEGLKQGMEELRAEYPPELRNLEFTI